MATLEYGAVKLDATFANLERAYFVRVTDVMCGSFPYAEPVVLVRPELAEQHPLCRVLEIVDTPADPNQAPGLHAALPLFVVDFALAWEYEAARPAVILRDLRVH